MKKLMLALSSCLWVALCAYADTPVPGTASPDGPMKRSQKWSAEVRSRPLAGAAHAQQA